MGNALSLLVAFKTAVPSDGHCITMYGFFFGSATTYSGVSGKISIARKREPFISGAQSWASWQLRK
jgi:hypothetical protein